MMTVATSRSVKRSGRKRAMRCIGLEEALRVFGSPLL
ncbi:Uncharacterised protein [Bordetella pertussis]|nr:Uncharacterised protein [Bordetella pertussis]